MSSATIVQAASKPWGVLMLDTQFPRWKGDIGCPDGWSVELRYQKVKGMFPKEILRSSETLQKHDVLPFFVQAAEGLISQGVGGITTSCGFLILLQNELQSRLPVPVITSSLLLLPQLLADNATVGVLTMDELALGDAHFLAAGVLQKDLSRLSIQGVSPSEEFAIAIMQNRLHMNFDTAQRSVVSAAVSLQKKSPELRHVVLECTNMPPYARAIEVATGWQLHSLHQLLKASSAAASK